MKGLGSRLRILGALAFVAAAFQAQASRAEARKTVMGNPHAMGMLPASLWHDPQAGKHLYRGGPGTRAAQRAAQKRRNVIRHRKACRG